MTFKMPPAWPIKTKQFTVQTSITQTLHIVEIIKNSTFKNWKRCNITYKTRQIVPLIDCSIFKKTADGLSTRTVKLQPELSAAFLVARSRDAELAKGHTGVSMQTFEHKV